VSAVVDAAVLAFAELGVDLGLRPARQQRFAGQVVEAAHVHHAVFLAVVVHQVPAAAVVGEAGIDFAVAGGQQGGPVAVHGFQALEEAALYAHAGLVLRARGAGEGGEARDRGNDGSHNG
jgi:hypothetical protein